MRIFLTGMMGSGKSFWAKKIASSGNMLFIDLDKYIEDKLFMSIGKIFKEKGETYFRIIENKYLNEIITTYENIILATGGGTPCFYDNMNQMKKSGRVIYLKTDIDELVKRIIHSAEMRPLINQSDTRILKTELEDILSSRKSIYEQSDIIIDMNQVDESNFAENFIKNYV